jgi:superfamily II DNA or RNA helicase
LTITVGNVWATTDGPEMGAIGRLLRYRKPGYIFSDAYRNHNWDGFNRLMTKGGRFPAGLVPYVLTRLASAPAINDTRVRPAPCDAIAPASLSVALAAHQEEAVSAGYREGRGIIDHCVGAGKSWVLAELVRRCGVPALVLVHTKELLRQNFEVLREVLDIPNFIGWIGDGQWEPNWITVATYQSINAAMRHYPKDVKRFMAQVQNVLVDECQHSLAPTYESVLKMTTEAYYRFGLSATPFRSDDDETFLKVTGWTGPVLSRVGPKEGVDVGRLVPADIYMVDYGAQDNGLPWPRQYEVGLVEHYGRNKTIADIVAAAPKPVLILIERLKHGIQLKAALVRSLLDAPVKNWATLGYINGTDTSKFRADMLKLFKLGSLRVLISSIILDEGVNLPDIRTLVLAGGGKAKHRLIQRVGRGQRKTEGKSSLIVFDMDDKGKYLGAHARRRAKTYEREPAYTLYRIGAKAVLEVLRG